MSATPKRNNKGSAPKASETGGAKAMAGARAPVPLRIPEARLREACGALLKHLKKEAARREAKADKKQLIDDDEDDFILVTFGLKKTPESAMRSLKGRPIPLPHSLRPGFGTDDAQFPTDVCLLVKDKKEAKKWLGDGDSAAGTLEDEDEVRGRFGIPGLAKIIDLDQLRKRYSTYESKRELCASYDVFICDDRIACMLPKTLGKAFYNGTAKRPLPIRFARRDSLQKGVAAKVLRAVGSSFLYLSGSCCTVRVGLSSFSEAQLAENVAAVVRHAVPFFPGKWKSVQSVFIKGKSSAALPLYTSLPTAKAAKRDAAAASKKPKVESETAFAGAKQASDEPKKSVPQQGLKDEKKEKEEKKKTKTKKKTTTTNEPTTEADDKAKLKKKGKSKREKMAMLKPKHRI